MTSVLGHLTNLDFERQYNSWQSCAPEVLFEVPALSGVYPVCRCRGAADLLRLESRSYMTDMGNRTRYQLPRISRQNPEVPGFCIYGLTAIERESILVLKYDIKQEKGILESK